MDYFFKPSDDEKKDDYLHQTIGGNEDSNDYHKYDGELSKEEWEKIVADSGSGGI